MMATTQVPPAVPDAIVQQSNRFLCRTVEELATILDAQCGNSRRSHSRASAAECCGRGSSEMLRASCASIAGHKMSGSSP